jgi:PAS domain S-box-containing protein
MPRDSQKRKKPEEQLASWPCSEYSVKVTEALPVLVVDDDAVSRHVIERALRDAGIAGKCVASGTQALAWLQRESASLVLLDLVMPEPDGYQMLAELRAEARTRDVPVVVLTALDSDDDVARAFEAGADDFLRKPFRPAELVARIRGQLRMRSYIEAISSKERDARVVLELTQTLASSLDFQQILFTVVQRVAEVARVDRCSIVLVESGNLGRVAATSDNQQLCDLSLDLDKYPEIQEVIASGLPLLIENTSTHPLLQVVREELPVQEVMSLALLPIVYEDRPMGVLFLRARRRIELADHELAIARTVANATAIALRNARVIKKLRDRTERVTFARFKAERRLRLLKRYAAFFESGADGILVVDLNWQVLFSNARARTMLGFSDSYLRGHRFDQLVVTDDRPRMQQLAQGFAVGTYPQTTDLRVRCSDGRTVLLSNNFGSVLRDDSVVLISFRDVTPERAVEAELMQTKEFLERVIGSSANAIISVDRSGIIRLFNRAAERCFGYAAEQAIGTLRAVELFPEGQALENLTLLGLPGTATDCRIEDQRGHVLSATRELVPVTLSAAPIFEGTERVGIVIIFTDLRDKLSMEARLAAAQEELQTRERQAIIAELAGAAAHELNQPLTSVMGYAELLKRKLEPGSTTHAATDVIINEAERMAEIVRKIGKITRYETKSYVGAAKILDLDRASEDRSSGARR